MFGKASKKERSDALLKLVGLSSQDGERYPSPIEWGVNNNAWVLPEHWANDPPLVLMDEPFGALDPITKQNLMAELVEKKLFSG